MLSNCIARLLQAEEKTLKSITKNMLELKCTKYLFAIMIDCPLNTLLTLAHPLLTHCSPTAHPLLTLAHLLLVKTHPKSSACKFSRTTSHIGRPDQASHALTDHFFTHKEHSLVVLIVPCPCTQCTPSVNARDHYSVPASHPPQLNTTMTIEEALAELDALDSSEDFCYAKIAKKYGVARSTLSRKHRGVSGSRAEAGLARRNL
jgi:hypothetical protein